MKNEIIFEHKGQYERELEIFTLKKFLETEFRDLCYKHVADLEAEYSYSDEPVVFTDIAKLSFVPIKAGDVWATKNFACAWFHLTAILPDNIDRNGLYLDFSCDGEGLLVNEKGSAIKGFTSGSPIFGIKDYNVEKRFYLADEFIKENGKFEAYIDCASNNILGEFTGNATLSSARLVRADEKKLELFYDFDTLFRYANTLSEGSEKKLKFVFDLRKVMNLIVYDDKEYYEKSKKILNSLFDLEGKEEISTVAVGHAHLDLAWLWPIRESKRKALRTFSNAVYLLKKYPEFHFVVSQPQQVQWVKENDPDLYESMKRFIKEGRMEPIGGGWVENDTNLPSGESLVRQELYGQKFWKEEFGKYSDVRWLPDTFGYSAALPQIYKKSGQDYFMTIKISWSDRTVFPFHTFLWKGIDGSEVTVHMPPEGSYNSIGDARALTSAKNGLSKDDPKDCFLTVFGVGDGGGGPSETMEERIIREEKIAYLPRVKQGRANEFFHSINKSSLKTYSGEMYLEKHRATYTSQSDNKLFNREFEEKMLVLEKIQSAVGKTVNKSVTDEMWKEALLYQFHDILPGSSIKRVYKETAKAYKRLTDNIEIELAEIGATFTPSRDNFLINTSGGEVTTIIKAKEDAYYGYSGNDVLIAPKVYEKGKVLVSMPELVTDHYSIDISDEGFISRISAADGKVVLRNANRLRVFIDRGDAWDFNDDYRDQPEVFMRLLNFFVRDFGDLIEIKQNYVYKNSKLLQTILVHKHDPIIRIYHDAEWGDTGTMLRAEFAPEVWSDVVHSDIQFGYLDRPTTENTEHETAQFEMCCGKWFDISDNTHGFGIINNVKNGFMAKRKTISVNLLRSFSYPDTESERHPVHYSYAIYPHTGGFDPIVIDDLADNFNARYAFGNTELQMPETDSENVVISAFKPAYDGNGYIIRAFERTGKTAKAHITLPKGYEFVCETNLLEDETGEASNEPVFAPFEIKTFRIKKKID